MTDFIQDSDSYSDNENKDVEQEDLDNWGGSKDVYYQNKRNKETKQDDFIDGDVEEGMRLQKQLLSTLKNTDFGGDDDFNKLLERAKDNPLQGTDEFQLKKFDESLTSTLPKIAQNTEEGINTIKELYPELMNKLQMVSDLKFTKAKKGGVMGQISKLRQCVESGLTIGLICELLCMGDGRERHPIVDSNDEYVEKMKYANTILDQVKNNMKAFYEGTYVEPKENEKIEEQPAENEEIEGLEEMEAVEQDEDDVEQGDLDEMSEEGENDEQSENGEFENEGSQNEFSEDSEDEQLEKEEKMIPQGERANWLDNEGSMDSDEEKLQEQLLFQMAQERRQSRVESGETDAKVRQNKQLQQLSTKLEKTKKMNEKRGKEEHDELEEEEKEEKDTIKKLENKRKVRLSKKQQDEDGRMRRPVSKVIEYSRGNTKGRKNMTSRVRERTKYEKRMRKIEKYLHNDTNGNSFSKYTGEKKINTDVRSRKLDM